MIHQLPRHAELGIGEHGGAGVAGIELVGDARQKHDRVFQPLGVVDADDLHRVALLGAAGDRLVVGVGEALHPGKEAEQSAVAILLKVAGEADERTDVFLAQVAVRHGGEQRVQIASLADPPQQGLHAQVRGHGAIFLQFGEKGSQIGALRGGQGQRGVKIRVFVIAADVRQIVGREAPERGAQRRDQRHVLTGIVDHGQQGEQHGDLR